MSPVFCTDPNRFPFTDVRVGKPQTKSAVAAGTASVALVSAPPAGPYPNTSTAWSSPTATAPTPLTPQPTARSPPTAATSSKTPISPAPSKPLASTGRPCGLDGVPAPVPRGRPPLRLALVRHLPLRSRRARRPADGLTCCLLNAAPPTGLASQSWWPSGHRPGRCVAPSATHRCMRLDRDYATPALDGRALTSQPARRFAVGMSRPDPAPGAGRRGPRGKPAPRS